MVHPNEAVERYIQNTAAPIVNGPLVDDDGTDYGFVYITATDTIHFGYDAEPTDPLTAAQHYYVQAFTVLGLWADNHRDIKSKDKDIQRFNCKLAALHLCNRFGIIKEPCKLTEQATKIVTYLDRLQP